jgi:hypothetical protein
MLGSRVLEPSPIGLIGGVLGIIVCFLAWGGYSDSFDLLHILWDKQRMKIPYLIVAVVLVGGLSGCGGKGGQEVEAPAPSQATTEQSTATTGTEAEGASCTPESVMVSAQANIFGAGRDFAPGPGGGGVVPPSWPLPEGSRVVTFPAVEGEVSPRAGERENNGPGGDGKGETDITSFDGISGIVDRRNGMFLVGVFLTDDEPSDPAPKRLDFTKNEDFGKLAPQVGQTFFIGDGEGRMFAVPPKATRLFLGFADAFSFEKGFYQGDPGYYSNNGGQLCVTVEAKQ